MAVAACGWSDSSIPETGICVKGRYVAPAASALFALVWNNGIFVA